MNNVTPPSKRMAGFPIDTGKTPGYNDVKAF